MVQGTQIFLGKTIALLRLPPTVLSLDKITSPSVRRETFVEAISVCDAGSFVIPIDAGFSFTQVDPYRRMFEFSSRREPMPQGGRMWRTKRAVELWVGLEHAMSIRVSPGVTEIGATVCAN